MLSQFASQITASTIAWSAIAVAVSYFLVEWLSFRIRYDWHKIPGPPRHPVIGDLLAFRRFSTGDPKIHEYTYYWWKKLGRPKVMRRSIGTGRFLMISDPSYVQKAVTGPRGMPKPTQKTILKGADLRTVCVCASLELFGRDDAENVAVRKRLDDEKWKAVRKNVAQAFSTENLKKTFPKVLHTAQQLMQEFEKVPEGEAIEVTAMLTYFTFEIVSGWGLGVQTDVIQKHNHPLLDHQTACGDILMRDALHPFSAAAKKWFPFSKRAKACREAFKKLHTATDLLCDRMDLDTPPADDDFSIAAGLKRAKASIKGESFSEAEMKSEAAVFLLAGADTGAQQISWTLCCLATNEHIQRKLAAELDSAGLGGSNPRDLEFDDLRSLPYLNAVVKETLRLLPANSLGSARALQEDSEILGYRVPKGTIVLGHNFILNRLEDMHKNPDTFDPDRWLNDELPTQQHDEKSGVRWLWSFSDGPRNCVAQRLAILEIQTMLALLLGRFRVDLDERMGGWEGVMAKKYDRSISTCKGGTWMKLIPRG